MTYARYAAESFLDELRNIGMASGEKVASAPFSVEEVEDFLKAAGFGDLFAGVARGARGLAGGAFRGAGSVAVGATRGVTGVARNAAGNIASGARNLASAAQAAPGRMSQALTNMGQRAEQRMTTMGQNMARAGEFRGNALQNRLSGPSVSASDVRHMHSPASATKFNPPLPKSAPVAAATPPPVPQRFTPTEMRPVHVQPQVPTLVPPSESAWIMPPAAQQSPVPALPPAVGKRAPAKLPSVEHGRTFTPAAMRPIGPTNEIGLGSLVPAVPMVAPHLGRPRAANDVAQGAGVMSR